MNSPEEFERRAQRLLADSADAMSGRVRSRLTQARHAALASATRARSPWRRWLPAGAVAAAVLVALVTLQPRPDVRATGLAGGASLEDMELLTDGEAFEWAQDRDIAREQSMDADFYEWAVAEAGSGQMLGT